MNGIIHRRGCRVNGMVIKLQGNGRKITASEREREGEVLHYLHMIRGKETNDEINLTGLSLFPLSLFPCILVQVQIT